MCIRDSTYAPRDAENAAPVAPKRTERVDDFADFSFGKIELWFCGIIFEIKVSGRSADFPETFFHAKRILPKPDAKVVSGRTAVAVYWARKKSFFSKIGETACFLPKSFS